VSVVSSNGRSRLIRPSMVFVAALFEDQPVIVDMAQEVPVKHSISSAPHRTDIEREHASEKQAAQDLKQTTTMTLFTPTGEHIIAGTNKGWLNIIDTKTHQVRYSFRVSNNIIVYIRLTPSGRDVVLNSSDRIVRTLHLPDLSDPKLDFDTLQLEVEHKFQDLVQRLSWNHVSFSPTGEYVTASTWMNHHIYVWERGQGSLVKILEGTKEELSVVEVYAPPPTKLPSILTSPVAPFPPLRRRRRRRLGPRLALVHPATPTLVRPRPRLCRSRRKRRIY
jgi:COMPASS component SWD1